MIVNLTFDVEEFDFPTEKGLVVDFDTQLKVSTDGLEAIIRLLDRHNIKATFYVTANYAQHKRDLIKSLHDKGHEIASHDFYHAMGSVLTPRKAKEALEIIIGQPVLGYRAPRLAQVATDVLREAGYIYNSSMNPTWLPGRYNNLLRPRTVYQEEGIIQYPTSVSWPLRFPLFWISFHVLPLWLYKIPALSALRKDGHLNLYFHPWEFSDYLVDTAFDVPGFIANCSGTKLLKKLESFIVLLQERDCVFQTTKKYLKLDELD